MSLFNRILKKAVNKVVDTVVDSVADKVTDTVKDKFMGQDQSRSASSVRASATVSNGASTSDCYNYQGSVDRYFAELIENNFPEYTVSRNVQMAGSGDVPVTFLLSRGDRHVLAVILCGSQEYRRLSVKNTVAACEARNIPVQRYFREFRNESGYVINRIKAAL